MTSPENPIQRQCDGCVSEAWRSQGEEKESQGQQEIQTKLTVGAAGDPYEQEADRVAAQVMSMSDTSPQVQRLEEDENQVQMSYLAHSITPVVQRQADEQIQMKPGENQASGDVESRLNGSKGGGSPLAPEVRAFMEPRFGTDFSGVRVHTGGDAVQMSKDLGAQAFTHGSDVYFGEGKSPGNNELTAHELTHVVQQTGGVKGKSNSFNSQGIQSSPLNIQRRGLTDQEQNFMNRLGKFAHLAKAETESYSGPVFATNVLTVKKDLLSQIGAVPDGKSDPDRLLTTLWSLHIWATDPTGYGYAEAIPNNGLNVRSFAEDTYKCNRFVGDAHAIGAKAGYGVHGNGGTFPTGKPGFLDPRPGYPVSANELASKNKAIGSLTNLPITDKAQMGNIISFPSTGIAHTGINLGNNVYISARNSKKRPVWDMQPEDGVQITEIKSGNSPVYREFKRNDEGTKKVQSFKIY